MAMTQIEVSKRQYHLNDAMINWCRNNISGFGGWVYSDPDDWHEGRTWAVSSMFGNTTFYFVDDKDATVFVLKWT
jgi:hypothetical protein